MRDYRKHLRASGRSAGTLVTDDAERAAQEILREELRPVIREAITEEVLEGIYALIGHVPEAVETAFGLLTSEDESIRLAASKLILQHTTGHKSIVPDVNEGQGQNMTVVFGVPRPEALQQVPGESMVIEEKLCDSCATTKPLGEFVGTSDRCRECFDRMKEIGDGIIKRTKSG